jgi:Sec-independent protein translocase protein TatA
MDLLVLLVIVLVLVFVWRGPKTLPKWGAALGRGFRDAKTEAVKAQTEIQQRASGTKDPTDPSDGPTT